MQPALSPPSDTAPGLHARAAASKEAHERRVFLEFAAAAALAVDPRLVVSRPPPEPDLLCDVHGLPVYFELGRLLDEVAQRLKLRSMHAPPGTPLPADGEVRAPERAVLRKKLGKRYAHGDVPVELVLYFDNENPIVGNVPRCADHEWGRYAGRLMVPELRATPRRFRRTWVFDRHRGKVLWCYAHREAKAG